MSKIEAAIIALGALGTDEALGAAAAIQIPGNTVEGMARTFARKAEQYRDFKGVSAARRAAAFQSIADVLANLPEPAVCEEVEYTVEQTETGVVLYVGPAASEADALDRMAVSAGYADFASIPAEIGGRETLHVTQIVAQ